ncbi:MAG: hypothetical protein FJ167_14795, partial [Gammaproteobacteria bacterium]|nr:hypothetical protein [Gammaproteobacteria bacterium]
MGSTFNRRLNAPASVVATLAALQAVIAAGVALAEPSKLTIDRLFATPDLSGPTPRGTRFSPDGKWVTYLQGK